MNRRDFLISATAGTTFAALSPAEILAAVSGKRNLIKSNLIHLGINMWGDDPAPTGEERVDSRTWPQDPTVERNPAWLTGCADYLRFDEEVYRKVIDRMVVSGMNQVVIDIGEGLQFPSHPEIAAKGAWSPDKMREEVRRLRALGIEAIPKLNFSTTHDPWLGDWRRTISTPAYYKLVEDLVRDTSEIFETPRFIHLGMDEERYEVQKNYNVIIVRNTEQWWHDVRWMVGLCEKLRMRPWLWTERLIYHRDKADFARRMPKAAMLSAAYYGPVADSLNSPEGSKGRYFLQHFLDLAELGYEQMPCVSNFNCEANAGELISWLEERLPPELTPGYLMAPWRPCVKCFEPFQLRAVDLAAKAMKFAFTAIAAGLLSLGTGIADTLRGEVYSNKVELPAFSAGADGIWRAKTPVGARFDQLWVNGELRTRAKHPNDGYLYIKDPVRPSFRGCLVGDKEYLKPLAGMSQAAVSNVLARLYYSWDTEPIMLDEVNYDRGYFCLAGPTYYSIASTYETRFTLENARIFLDAPGEWYLDREAGELLYLPLPSEQINETRAAYAKPGKLLELKGESGRVFDGCTFEYSGHLFARHFHSHQAAHFVNGAVELNYCTNIVFKNCTFRHLTEHALWVNEGCRNVTIENCTFEYLGASAVRVGPRFFDKAKHNEAENVVMKNCRCLHGGRVFPEACGITFTHVANCKILNNEVCDFVYSGINIGWTWGYPGPDKVACHDNLIDGNHVWRCGNGTLGDMGGIYNVGESPGTVISHNFVHDIWSNPYGAGAHGIYLDEGSTLIKVLSNRVARCSSSSFTLHYGRENYVDGNLFTCGELHPEQKDAYAKVGGRPESHTQLIFGNNEVTTPDDSRFSDLPKKSWKPSVVEPKKRGRYKEYAANFEEYQDGESVTGNLEVRGSKMMVTSKKARKGNKSLAFIETDRSSQNYMPHLFSIFDHQFGKFAITFSILTDGKAVPSFSVRDYTKASITGIGFAVGPGFTIKDGVLLVNGAQEGTKELCRVEIDEWLDIALGLTMHGDEPATWKLRVTKASTGEKFTFSGTAKNDFLAPDWIGFTSDGPEGATYYIDDLQYKPVKEK